MRKSLEERFWAKVDRSGGPEACWGWQAGTFGKVYGAFQLHGKAERAHRVAWAISNGMIPDGLDVLHKCDNPACCNPAHLFLGTNLDNIADRQAKGRQAKGDRTNSRRHPERYPRGAANPSTKLTEGQVRDIKARLRLGREQQTAIARACGVADGTISAIKYGRIWRWLDA